MPAAAEINDAGMSNEDKKSLQSILEGALTPLRIDIFQHKQNKSLNAKYVKDVMAAIEVIASGFGEDFHQSIRNEIEKSEKAVKDGKAAVEKPDFNSPLHQLVWGVRLAFEGQNRLEKIQSLANISNDKKLEGTELWTQVTTNERVADELLLHALNAVEITRDKNLRFKWVGPETGTKYEQESNVLSIDLTDGLIHGLEHARSALLPQITAIAVGREYPKPMRELREKMLRLHEKVENGEALTEEQYKKMHLMGAEWSMYNALFQSAESLPAHAYAERFGHLMAQDHGVSLNYTHVYSDPTGQYAAFASAMPDKEALPGLFPDDGASSRFSNLMLAIKHMFFIENGLTTDSMDDWKTFGINPEWITVEDSSMMPEQAFSHLKELCVGEEGLMHLFPEPKDRLRGKAFYEDKSDELSAKRNTIIEEIWNLYARQYTQEMLQEAGQQMDENRGDADKTEKMMKESEHMQPSKDKAEVENSGDMPDAQMPQESPGQSQEQDGQEMGQPQEGQEGDGQSLEEMMDKIREMMEEMEKQQGEGEEEGEGQEQGQGQPQQGQGQGQEGDGQQEGMPQSAEQGQKGDEGQDGEGAGAAKTLEEIFEEMKNQSLEEMAQGDWSDYKARVSELQPVILQVARKIREIQEKQRQIHYEPSPKNSLIPEDGDLKRFDKFAYHDRIKKIATGQPIAEEDLYCFKKDKVTTVPAPIDIVILIDGSGSMNSSSQKPSPMEMAFLTSVVLYEAAKMVDVEGVFVIMWGDDPKVLAKPGDHPMEIGKALEGAKKGLGSSSNLAPGVIYGIDEVASMKKPAGAPSGYTHMMVISDGDISDKATAHLVVERLMQNSDHVTLDCAISNQQSNMTNMESFVRELQKKSATRNVGVNVVKQAKDLFTGIIDMLTERMWNMPREHMAVPFGEKQSELKRAVKRIEEERGRGGGTEFSI